MVYVSLFYSRLQYDVSPFMEVPHIVQQPAVHPIYATLGPLRRTQGGRIPAVFYGVKGKGVNLNLTKPSNYPVLSH